MKLYGKLALIATIFAFFVILVGAYTRLTDAGLGCPDWPGCYGQLTAPETTSAIAKAEQVFPSHVVESTKAATEMFHRYLAGILGVLVLILVVWGVARSKQIATAPALLIFMLLVVIFQALLGMWTVTMKLLPIVVMGHLLGGFLLISLLWLLTIKSNHYYSPLKIEPLLSKTYMFSTIALILLILQIALGAWTSTNYAALACRSVPFCNVGNITQQWDFTNAFQWLVPFDQLSEAAKQTIQMCHRVGAVVVLIIIGWLSLHVMARAQTKETRKIAVWLLIILIVQLILGLLNVILTLPLAIAVAHNGVAAILLLTLLTMNFMLYRQKKLSA